jgi:hypothetical protein
VDIGVYCCSVMLVDLFSLSLLIVSVILKRGSRLQFENKGKTVIET